MTAPALLIAVPLVIGVVYGASIAAIPHELAILAASWTLGAAALARRWTGTFVVAATVAYACAGAALGAAAQRAAVRPPLIDWYTRTAPSAPVRLTGTLRADASVTATGVSLALDVVTADGRPAAGGARLTVLGTLAPAAAGTWRAGRPVVVDATVHEPLDYRNPGVASDRMRLARQGIALLGSVKSGALVTITARGGLLSEAAGALRAYVRSATAATVGRWSPASAAVVTAILIGDRSALDSEDERRLQEAGTYHVIAISGGNIALLTALLVACGRAVRLPIRAAPAAALIILAFYGYAAGLAPSVSRATIGGIVYLAARAFDHRGPVLNAIAVAASFAAITAPLSLLDPGFVLSFGATLAIVIGAQRVASAPDSDIVWPSRLRRWTNRTLHAALLLGVATLCAELALAPIGARLFGRISLAGLILNFAAIPLMSVIQVAGLIAVAILPLLSAAAAPAGWIAHAATTALLRSASLVDYAPWLVIDLPPPGWGLAAVWYAGVSGLLFLRRRRRRLAAGALAAIAAAIMIVSPPATRATRVPAPPRGWTRVVFLDVGQGDATLILPPDAGPLLIDAGGTPGTAFDLGRRVILPSVWAFGVTRLSALTLTHGDPDHVGGAPAVLRALAPREIWDGIPVPPHEPMRRIRDIADRQGIRWIARRTGESFAAGALRIRVLNPPEPDWERRRVRNDDSVVLELRVGDVALLLPGDITAAVEPQVVQAFEPAPIVIVKAPHHGSAGSSSQAFVDALHPAIVIFSAGRRNPFGHPAPATVERYRMAGARIFSTAADGAVVMETDGREVRVFTCGVLSPSPTRSPSLPVSPGEPNDPVRGSCPPDP